MPDRLMPSDARYPHYNRLQTLLRLITNPNLHWLGYGMGATLMEIETNKFIADGLAAETIAKLLAEQQKLIDG